MASHSLAARLALSLVASAVLAAPAAAQPSVVRTYHGYACLTDPFTNACSLDVWAAATTTYDPVADNLAVDLTVSNFSRTGIDYYFPVVANDVHFGGLIAPLSYPALFMGALVTNGSVSTTYDFPGAAFGPFVPGGSVSVIFPQSLFLNAEYVSQDPSGPIVNSLNNATLVFMPTPEPATLALVVSGALLVGAAARRRRV